MKKACFISIKPYPIDTFIVQRADNLISENFNIDIITIRAKDQLEFEQSENINIYRVVDEPTYKMGFFKYLLNSLKYMFWAFKKIQKIAPGEGYDLILIFAIPEYLIFTALFQKKKKTRIILYLLDLSYELFKTRIDEKSWSMFNNKLVKYFLLKSEQLSCAFADYLITASPGFKQCLIERGIRKNKLDVIMNTADDSIFQFNIKTFDIIKNKARIIYHGTVSERFGVLNVIKALALINDLIPESEFYVFGEYDIEYKQLMIDKAKRLKIYEKVFLNERKDLKTIYNHITEMDFGVVPYQNQEFMHIALSTKGFEYVASGLPVVASRTRSMQSIFDEKSIAYFEPENEKELAERIISLCLNPEKRKEQVEHANKEYQKVSAHEMRKRFLKIVNNIL